MDWLETVANIGQSPAEEHRHGVGHVGLGGLLVELGGHDSATIPTVASNSTLDQHAAVPISPVVAVLLPRLVPEPRFHHRRPDGRWSSVAGEKAEVREGVAEAGGEARGGKDERRAVAEEQCGKAKSGRESHGRDVRDREELGGSHRGGICCGGQCYGMIGFWGENGWDSEKSEKP